MALTGKEIEFKLKEQISEKKPDPMSDLYDLMKIRWANRSFLDEDNYFDPPDDPNGRYFLDIILDDNWFVLDCILSNPGFGLSWRLNSQAYGEKSEEFHLTSESVLCRIEELTKHETSKAL